MFASKEKSEAESFSRGVFYEYIREGMKGAVIALGCAGLVFGPSLVAYGPSLVSDIKEKNQNNKIIDNTVCTVCEKVQKPEECYKLSKSIFNTLNENSSFKDKNADRTLGLMKEFYKDELSK